MPTPFEQLMQQLADAEGDSDKLALITFDFTVKDDPELKAAAEAAAVPHWFDEAVLAALLPERATEAEYILESLKKLPMVETYPMEDRSPAWNLHEATRNALRRRMWETDLPRFRELSRRAADHFGDLAGPLEETKEGVEKNAPWRIEAFCHRLLAKPPEGADDVVSFVMALFATHRLERLQAIAALLEDLVDGPWKRCEEEQRVEDAHEWARAQFNLGIALANLGECVSPCLGNRLLEQSVYAWRAALKVYTRESLPQDWAMTQNNLGNVLQEQGSRNEGLAGLAEAVVAYRAALEVYTRESLPQNWAMTQSNLGNALAELGHRVDGQAGVALLKEATTAYRAAQEIYTRDSFPLNWAGTQNNLGAALREQGRRSEGQEGFALLADAITAYRLALEVYTREKSPQDWAMTKTNLGNALRQQGLRSGGSTALGLLAEAVATHRAALEVYTRESLPQNWAATQNNLGNSLIDQGDNAISNTERRRLYNEAEAACLLALEVRTAEALPYYHQKTQENLDEVRARLKALEDGEA